MIHVHMMMHTRTRTRTRACAYIHPFLTSALAGLTSSEISSDFARFSPLGLRLRRRSSAQYTCVRVHECVSPKTHTPHVQVMHQASPSARASTPLSITLTPVCLPHTRVQTDSRTIAISAAAAVAPRMFPVFLPVTVPGPRPGTERQAGRARQQSSW